MRKKLLVGFLAAFMVLTAAIGFTACGENDGEDGETFVAGTEGLSYERKWDGTYTVTGMGTCTATEIVIGNVYNNCPVTAIGERAFYDSEITSVTISNSITSIGYEAFYGCSGIIQTDNGVQYVNKWAIDCDKSLTSVTLRADTIGIADGTFYVCNGLTKITIPQGVIYIGAGAFRYCGELMEITIPDSVTSIGYEAFQGCGKITSITIPNSVTSIEDTVFDNCSGLTEITIPNSIEGIGSRMFRGCSGLTKITIPDSVTWIGLSAFYKCSELTSILFEGTIKQWRAISKGTDWDGLTGDFTVQCTDGKLDRYGNEIE